MKAFVISLKDSHRRNTVRLNFEGRNIDYEFLDAVDARDWTEDEWVANVWPPCRNWRNYLRPGAVACALSHREAYLSTFDCGMPFGFICEDDAIPQICSEELRILAFDFLQSPYDIWLLGSFGIVPVELKKSQSLSVTNSMVFQSISSEQPGGAIGYFIKVDAAAAMAEYNWPVRAAADAFSNFGVDLDLRIGVVKPDLIIPDHSPSQIDYLSINQKTLSRLVPSYLKTLRRKIEFQRRQRLLKIDWNDVR